MLEELGPSDCLLKSDKVASWLGVSESFLAQARVSGRGPKFLKVGRLVFYRPQDVRTWLEGQTRASTSQAA
ncbi:putative DNA-binding transcriptional regulator AlpA [Rhodoligotrophos appendicifer]